VPLLSSTEVVEHCRKAGINITTSSSGLQLERSNLVAVGIGDIFKILRRTQGDGARRFEEIVGRWAYQRCGSCANIWCYECVEGANLRKGEVRLGGWSSPCHGTEDSDFPEPFRPSVAGKRFADQFATEKDFQSLVALWRELDQLERPENSALRAEAIAWCKDFMKAMPTIHFTSKEQNANAWGLLAVNLYCLHHPNTQCYSKPCPDAAYCVEQLLEFPLQYRGASLGNPGPGFDLARLKGGQ
jgi:hypothetical protein